MGALLAGLAVVILALTIMCLRTPHGHQANTEQAKADTFRNRHQKIVRGTL